MYKLNFGEFARSTRTSNGVANLKDSRPLIVLVTLTGTAPPNILTFPKDSDPALVLVPVTAKPLGSVAKVTLMEPRTVALTPMEPEDASCPRAASVKPKANNMLVRIT
jgi:hypothetical protein